MARLGLEWIGRRGKARLGKAVQATIGLVRRGMARCGMADRERLGEEWPGSERQAWLGRDWEG